MPDNSSSTPPLDLAPLSSAVSWHDALSHPDGRDRLFRLLQYTLKFLRGSLAGRNTKNVPPLIARIVALESTLAAARQVWRLFKWSGFYSKTSVRKLLQPAALAPTSLTSALATLQDACLASYMALDNITFLTKTSVIAGDIGTASRRAARAWFAASMLGLVNALRRLHTARQSLLSSPPKGAELRARRFAARRHLTLAVKYAGDVVVSYSLTRVGNDGAIAHPALVGACGVVSSLVGFSDVWPRRGGHALGGGALSATSSSVDGGRSQSPAGPPRRASTASLGLSTASTRR